MNALQRRPARATASLEDALRAAAAARTEPCPYKSLPDSARWPGADSAIVAQHEPRFRVSPYTRIATAGSCFAQHFGHWLQANEYAYVVTEPGPPELDHEQQRVHGYGVYSARYGNVYTARQLVQLFDRAHAAFVPVEPPWPQGDGFVDPFRPRVQPLPFASLAALDADRAQHFAAVREAFATCELFVFTLGLTEAWRSRADGAVLPTCPGCGAGTYAADAYEFVNFSVEETEADLDAFLARLAGVNPRARVLLTVSPVPLVATMAERPALQSTVYSKSVLRVAAQRIRDRHAHVEYFASYEMVTLPFAGEPAFGPDRRTVTTATVARVMRAFAQHFVQGHAESVHSPSAVDADAIARSEAANDGGREPSICDEVAAYALQMPAHELLASRPWEHYAGNTSTVYCPADFRDGTGQVDKALYPPRGYELRDHAAVGPWLDAVGVHAGDGVTLCLGGSTTARSRNWPFHLHRLPGMGPVLNLGANGSVAAFDRRILAAVAEALRERRIPIRRAIHLVGYNDVHIRLVSLARFARGEQTDYASDHDRAGLGGLTAPPRPRLGHSVRRPRDDDEDLALFLPGAAWEHHLTRMVAAAVDSVADEAARLGIPFTSVLQPIATDLFYPLYGRVIRSLFEHAATAGVTPPVARLPGESFVAWRRRNHFSRGAGENAAMTKAATLGNDLNIDGVYQGLVDHFRERGSQDYVDLSMACISRESPQFLFKWDACHYSPAGAAFVAEEIHKAL